MLDLVQRPAPSNARLRLLPRDSSPAPVQAGYLFLADITGFTEFVTRTGHAHGAGIVAGLMRVLLEESRAPLRVIGLEGDAVFSVAPTRKVAHGGVLVETIERMYARFHAALDGFVRNAACGCRGCATAERLDLKFVVHHGTFSPLVVRGHESVSGSDVILAHRLLKNSVREATETAAYALFTDAAVRRLGLESWARTLTPHRETYPHFGAVDGFVYDLEADRTRPRPLAA